MQISNEGKIGLALSLAALAGAGALVVAHGPVLVVIGWVSIAVAFAGVVLLAHHHFRRPRMIPVVGMIVFGLGFITMAAWYYWPAASSETVTANSPGTLSPVDEDCGGRHQFDVWAIAANVPSDDVVPMRAAISEMLDVLEKDLSPALANAAESISLNGDRNKPGYWPDLGSKVARQRAVLAPIDSKINSMRERYRRFSDLHGIFVFWGQGWTFTSLDDFARIATGLGPAPNVDPLMVISPYAQKGVVGLRCTRQWTDETIQTLTQLRVELGKRVAP